jgi:L-serine dehydratase
VLSVLDIFKIGIGPSSSHTMGPMNAACTFAEELQKRHLLPTVARVRSELFGSLGLTGKGHCSDRAVLLGLEGKRPATIDGASMEPSLQRIRGSHRMRLLDAHEIDFQEERDLLFNRRDSLPAHPNGMRFTAFDAQGTILYEEEFYSVGGGFVLRAAEIGSGSQQVADIVVPYPFGSGDELLTRAGESGLPIHEMVLANERVRRSDAQTRAALLGIWEVMQACIQRGLTSPGILPGVLKVRRRAPGLNEQLAQGGGDALDMLDRVNTFAIAVNEENAAGGRVVTAPTNGAAGVVPAVLAYYRNLLPRASDEGVVRFLLVAGAIALLYKKNASLSGAEMGCQGEVGVACSMAAAGLVAALGGSSEQIENAAEIGMEHNLGLTCDPVAGLVQIPCIERNAMGAVKAINASRLAMRGDGQHKVSLDQVIATMRQTGNDMKAIYKETSQGGLAVNVPEC